jgi:anti-sigma regulatory factor (Ser/Thr protein kinase)
LQWPADRIDELLLAVNEAVNNVVDHAYSTGHGLGSASIDAGVAVATGGLKHVIVVVKDRGVWRSFHTRVHHPRGLRAMRACTHSLQIQHATSGTKVIMASRPVR